MNFLAHLYLSDDHPASWVGNLMPDLVRGRLPADLPPRIREGVRCHRRVDAFTDTHPLVARSKNRLRPNHGRFASILVDIFYDHLLARHWRRHHALPLPEFARRVHHGLGDHLHLMPQPMQRITHRMAQQNWLCLYADLDGIELTLRRMSQRFSHRLRRTVRLHDAMPDFARHDHDLEADFHAFFPQLVRYIHTPLAESECDPTPAPRPAAARR